MKYTHSSQAKKRINVTLAADLLEEARQMGLNLSQSAEAGIAAALKRQKEEQWLKDNAKAIEAYNRRVDEQGLLLKPIWEKLKDS